MPLHVFIDSGADDNVIDLELAAQANIPLEPLPEPKDISALDGKLLFQVIHRTAPLTLILLGNHH